MKRKVIGLLIAFIAGATVAIGANHTITLTAAQELRATRVRNLLNATGSSYADTDALMQDLCTQELGQRFAGVAESGDLDALVNRAKSASQAQRDNACTAMGGTVVNNRCN